MTLRCLLVGLLLLPAWLLAQPYGIDRYDVTIDLRADGSMKVTEQIAVTFNMPRRGIFRFIPISYETGRGTGRALYLSRIDVTDENGNAMTTLIERDGRNARIRIGDEDIVFPGGTKKTYRISYEAFGMINWFTENPDWDKPTAELYWNVTGDQWDTSIGEASCKVRFPRIDLDKGLRARAFVGAYGSGLNQTLFEPASDVTDPNTSTVMSLSNGEFSVTRTAPLRPYEGLTIVLSLPEEAIARPSTLQAIGMFLRPNLGFAIPFLVLPFMIVMWFLFGRDPHGGPMVVQFEPPEGLSGPEVGAMVDERVDQRDLSAGFISLATKGYLKIYPSESGLFIKRRTAELEVTGKPKGPDLTSFEANLLARLASAGTGRITENDLRTDVAPHVSALRSTLYQQLVARGYYLKSPETVRTLWMVLGIAGCVGLAILSTLASPVPSPAAAWVGGISGSILVILFARGMPKRTPHGSRVRRQVEGFEEFIQRARGDELEFQSKKQPDMALFEEYLPHAIAFGLTVEWARAFEGILRAMPSWYVVPDGTPYNYRFFSSDLNSINSQIGSAASTPPRSSGASGGGSGFSGGGFSGGGFGGGGGGSW